MVFPEPVENFKITDNRLTVQPTSGRGSFFRINNVEVVNYEEIWFEFEYGETGFFDATKVGDFKYQQNLTLSNVL